jgi:hypothetical protein
VNICKAKDGSIICDQNGVLTRWKENLDDLLNINDNQEYTAGEDEDIQPIKGPTVEDTDPPTFEELEEVIKKLKNNKASEADGITAEIFKQGRTELKNLMFRLILRIRWGERERRVAK